MPQGRNSARRMARIGAVIAVTCAYAQAATAQVSQEQYAYYPDPAITYSYPGPPSAVLSIPVTATVGGTCGFATAPNDNLNVGNIDTTAWTRQVAFVPECTAPWRIAVSSQNGGLTTGATVPVGYRNKAPYTVSLNVNSDSGLITGSCPVEQIDQAAGSTACTFEGTASPTNGLLIPRSFGLSGSYIQMEAPAYPGPDLLITGTYNDTLVVTISPAS